MRGLDERYRKWARQVGAAVAVVALLGLLRVAAGEAEPDAKPSAPAPTSDTSTTSSVDPTTTTIAAEPWPELPLGTDTIVESITDGDTLRVSGGQKVRLIGIDAPEKSGAVECFSSEATAHLDDLVPAGTPVRLVLDVEPTDRYGRTLAYLYRSTDGLFVNIAMAADGYASQLTVPPNVAHVEEIGAAVAAARAAQRGLWRACPDPDAPLPETTTTTTTTTSPPVTQPLPVVPPTTAEPVGSCDPSYPTVCISPAPPDLDCGDIPHKRFTVLAPDPHGFDGNDNDGIGCESG